MLVALHSSTMLSKFTKNAQQFIGKRIIFFISILLFLRKEKLFSGYEDFSFLKMVFRGDDVGLLSNQLNHGVYGKEN